VTAAPSLEKRPATGGADPILTARAVEVSFGSRGWRRNGRLLRAVDGVDLELYPGEALALVGESGSGKSTFAKAVTGLERLSGGGIDFEGRPLGARRSRSDARRIQMVFQDPYSSLNPRMTVGSMLKELLRVHGVVPRDQVEREAGDLLERVGLGREALSAHPRQFSGGQRQRVAIARALALRPDVLVADEPVSALDVSVQATILNLLDELRADMGLTLLFIAHNLAVVHHLCDRVAVMYLGRVVEVAPTRTLFADPRHPYTQALLRAIPRMTPSTDRAPALKGDPPSPLDVPSGCRFRTRCPRAEAVCAESDPALAADPDAPAATPPVQHRAACHFAFDTGPTSPAGDAAGAADRDAAPTARHIPTDTPTDREAAP
jgi:oligopeptide/dipeptide ABC transporter ATP-binding protein